MDDLDEHMADLFGVADVHQPWDIGDGRRKTIARPQMGFRKCIRPTCKAEVLSPRRVCDTHYAETIRRNRTKNTAAGSKRNGDAVLALVTEGWEHKPTDKPADEVGASPESELPVPHSSHSKPIFGCGDCFRKAFPTENPLLRRPR